jgi:hypothetical protein
MLMKLELPFFNRMFPGGFAHRWFKQVGDRIDYGEEVLEVRVEEARVTKTVGHYKPVAEWLQKGQQAAAGAPQAAQPGSFKSWRCEVLLRVTSSDVGYLRRIEVAADDYRETGALLAWLTSEKDEPIPEAGADAPEASLFRVATSMVDVEED